jgi:hypothetical protein
MARALTHALALPILATGLTGAARAAEYHVSSAGNDAGTGSATSHFRTIHRAAAAAVAGDTVYIHGGTYTESVNLTISGTPSAWITFSAFPGELPILDGGGGGGTGFGGTTAEYIRVVGLVSRNWGSTGFGNGWVNDTGASNGNWQFINCIAEGNAINGITFYNATGLLIDQSIIAHNGNGSTSWSSGINLFHVPGDHTTNLITRNVSFENIDISAHHSDGSGFILDQSSSGALFQNNIGFRNGGSCIRINCPGAHLVNNTCWHNGLDPKDALGLPSRPGELYFTSGLQGAVVLDNLLAASGYGNDQPASNQTLPATNLAVSAGGPTPFFSNPVGIDFRLGPGAGSAIDQGAARGDASDFPQTDIGFDPSCIKPQAGVVAWWQYAPDYTYIASVGGVAGCFRPTRRPQGQAPDIGAYEAGGAASPPGTGGGTAGKGGGGGGGGSPAASGSGGRVGGAATGGGPGSDGSGISNASGGGASGPPGTAGSGGGAAVESGGSSATGAHGGTTPGAATSSSGGATPGGAPGTATSGGVGPGGGTGSRGPSESTTGTAGSGCACASAGGGLTGADASFRVPLALLAACGWAWARRRRTGQSPPFLASSVRRLIIASRRELRS